MKNAYTLISLSSGQFTDEYFRKLWIDAADKYNAVDVYLLNYLEAINQNYIYGITGEDIDNRVKNKENDIIDKISKLKCNIFNIVRFDNIIENRDYHNYYSSVEKEYEENASFHRHCINQTYKNLQPILASAQITKKNIKNEPALTKYLIHEISLKLYLNNNDNYIVEYAPRPEMDIMQYIYAGKYNNLYVLLKKIVDFKTII